MNVLMIGVDKTSIGGMLTVAENYLHSREFCQRTNLIYIPTVIRAGKLTKIITFLKVLPKIAVTIYKKRIDIVHIHMGERGSVFREGFVAWLAKRMGVRTVIHMHGATIEEWYDRQKRPVQRIASYFFGQADRMIVLGHAWVPFMERAMGKDKKQRIVVLHNAVSVRDKNEYHKDARNLLFYGVIVRRKGIDDLLRAFRTIADDIPKEVMLTIYGADLEHNIQEKIEKYHLEGRAVYLGWLSREDQEQCFAKTMLNILPSYNEGLPMTILETMAYGIPNISTDIAAIPEAVTDGINGRLVEPGEADQLAGAMKELILNSDLRERYSENAWKKIREEFSFKTHLSGLYRIYDELIRQTG